MENTLPMSAGSKHILCSDMIEDADATSYFSAVDRLLPVHSGVLPSDLLGTSLCIEPNRSF